jgi:pilus assembly protein TadC
MKVHYLFPFSILIAIVVFSFTMSFAQSADTDPPRAFLINPLPDNRTSDQNPVITIQLIDNSDINMNNFILEVDGFDVSDWEETEVSQTNITHHVPELFTMEEGNHTVHLFISDEHGNSQEYEWTFIVDLSYGKEKQEIDYFRIFMISIVLILIILFVIGISLVIYLKVTRDFNFIKFYRRHPLDTEKTIMFTPMIVGLMVFLGGMIYQYQYEVESEFFTEYLLLLSFFIFITAYAIHAQLEKKNTTAYEHAFSQLLFELADAMRGGIDPAKAIVELSNTNTGILNKQLRIAAKNIKAGRPFEEVLITIAQPTRSRIIIRYASLIGEASKVGGEIAQVVHRSAKDMEDMLKVKSEKRRALMIQIFTIYIAFAVLVAIMWMLIGLYPKLSEMDFSLITNFNLESATSTDQSETLRMTPVELKKNFFHLLLINSLGSGLIIGKLIDGKMKYGLNHGLILMALAVVVFVIFIF